MMRSKLTVCSSLLYHWIRFHQNGRRAISFEPKNFQAWTGEFLEHCVSTHDIKIALSQLHHLNLIATDGKTVQLKESPNRARLTVLPLPKLLVQVRSGKAWLIGAVLTTSMLALWVGSVAVYRQSSNAYLNQAIELNPYQVLGDKLE